MTSSKVDAHVLVGDKLAVATVSVPGEITKSGGAVDATAIINTENGPQKVVKTVLVGEDGESASVIIKSKTIPEATSATVGQMRIYAGTTNANYTHGYIYECTADTTYEALIDFEPAKIGFDYTKGNLQTFFSEMAQDPSSIVGGKFTFLKAGNIWSINGLDKNGETVFNDYKLYTEDLEDAGFVFTFPPDEYKDGDEINYEVRYYAVHNNPKWERIDVQP